jgi:hypothetical protein
LVADAQNIEKNRQAVKVNADVERRFNGSWSGYERDRFFHNPHGHFRAFVDASYVMGLDFADDGRAALPLDVDGDGDLDLVLLSLQGLRLMENRAAPTHFARLRLRAASPPHAALGAMVEVSAGGVTSATS